MDRWARVLPTDLLLSCSGDISRIAASPQPEPGQRFGPFRHGQQAVHCHAGADAPLFKIGHLVGHQGDQGRYDHCDGAGLVVPGEGRHLVADRLAGASGQNGQQVLSGHGPLDDGLLQGNAILIGGFGPEVGKSKPAGQFLLRIVALPAPLAVPVLTGRVPQQFQYSAGLGEFVQHPGRHGRVAAGHGEPGQGIGQGPALLVRVGEDALGLAGAGLTGQAAPDGLGAFLNSSNSRLNPAASSREVSQCQAVSRSASDPASACCWS